MKETLEAAAENYVSNETDSTLKLISKYSFRDGSKWQAERMYSEEEVEKIAKELFFTMSNCDKGIIHREFDFDNWLKQFKKE
jgi:hypothetical protein